MRTPSIFLEVIGIMKSPFVHLSILALLLLGLPLLGIILANKPLSPYLEFPPRTLYVQHAPFSWLAFLSYAAFILAVTAPFVVRVIKRPGGQRAAQVGPFPWWGWLGMVLGIIAWVLAWSRFPWFNRFQTHTFTPLWIAYIIIVNALTYSRTGHCLLLNRTRFYLLLFPLSALFWWFFEYLNRFVQNWHYVGGNLDPLEYFLYATLPFSTVLPAVVGTREWLLVFWASLGKFRSFLPLQVWHPKFVAWAFFLAAGMGLAGIGIWPDYLFPLLWVSPLLIIVSLQAISERRHIFSDLARGNWQWVLSSVLAALICGFFWEMWNYYSFTKWKYNIPFVHRFQIFEMPILGYAGYLPFGIQCTVVADMILNRGEE